MGNAAGGDRLFNGNFLLLFQGQLVSQIGNAVFAVAVVFWIKHETSSATIIGLFGMMAFLPVVLLGPLGGVLADLFPRKKILVYSDLVMGCATLAVAVPMAASLLPAPAAMALLLLLALVGSSISAVFRPAVNSLIPNLVSADKVQGATGTIQGSVQAAQLFGQVFGGILFRTMGMPALMIANGITYLLSSLSECFITVSEPKDRDGGGAAKSTTNVRTAFSAFKVDTLQGLSYVRSSPGLLRLFVIAGVMNFFLAPILVLLPFFIEDHLGLLPDWYGYTIGAMAVGTLVGSGLAGGMKLGSALRAKVLLAALGGLGGAFGAFALSRNVTEAMLTMVLVGICSGMVNVLVTSAVQITTPDSIRGRVFGLLNTISTALLPVGMGLSGFVADVLNQNLALVFLLCGVASLAPVPLLAASKAFHEFMSYDTTPSRGVAVDGMTAPREIRLQGR